jgi:hypothetical protein
MVVFQIFDREIQRLFVIQQFKPDLPFHLAINAQNIFVRAIMRGIVPNE